MAIRLDDKKQIVSEVNQAAASALSAVLADYRGVTVEQLTALRKTARESQVYLRVVRNTLPVSYTHLTLPTKRIV